MIFIFCAFLMRENQELIARYGRFDWNPFLMGKDLKILVDSSEEYKPIFSLSSILKGFLWAGTFPVFPCLAYPLVGFATGKIFIKSGSQILKPMMLLSVLFLLASGVMVAFSSDDVMLVSKNIVSPYSFYPLSLSMILLQFFVTFSLFVFVFEMIDSSKKNQAYQRFSKASRLSRYSLTIYVLHYLLIFWPIRFVGALEGDSEKYVSNALTPETASLVGILMIFSFLILTKFWDGYQGKYSVEWFLSKLRKKTSVSGSSGKVQSLSSDPSQF